MIARWLLLAAVACTALAALGVGFASAGTQSRGSARVSAARGASPTWTGNYARRPLSQLWGSQEKSAPERIAVVNDPRQGRVVRYEIRDGETARITNNERVETRDPLIGGRRAWRGNNGQDWWFGWRFKLAPGFETQNNFNYLTQWKGWNPDTGSPALGLTAGETLRLKAGTQADQVLVWKGPRTAAIKGRWQDMVVHIKVSNTRRGVVEIWSGRAGRLRRQRLLGGRTRWIGRTLHAGHSNQYLIFKQGIYRDVGAFNGTSQHYIKAPRIGHSFRAVRPR